MGDGLRRFLHLERPRAPRAGDAPAATPAPAGRFDGVERRAAAEPAPATATGVSLDRFGPEPEPRIELVEIDGGRQPFTRCMRCGMDSSVFATECPGCTASLDTEAQRAFNERLWLDRRADAAREEGAAADRRELQARAAAEDAKLRREYAEALAREVGDRERRRLAADGYRFQGRWGWDPLSAVAAILFRLVRNLFRR
jgi:hypothetical protein